MKKKGISYIEVLIAFFIFFIGISILFFIFSPYFRPGYFTALDIIERNFEKNFAEDFQIVKVIINQTGCIKFKAYKNFNKENILFFNKNWNKLNFDLSDGYIILENNEKEILLLTSSKQINQNGNIPCNQPNLVNIYYSPPINEKFININFDIDYENLKNLLIPNLNVDFNISIYDTKGNLIKTFGKNIPRTNVFAREKIYKNFENNEIKFVKIIFYVW